MSSEARLYQFSPETTSGLRKFRLGTSRASEPQAKIYQIDPKTLEIREDGPERYTSLVDVADALPENSPRFVLLSHPVTMKSGRRSQPYVMLYYMPENANNQLRMIYAGAKELMRNTAEVGKVMDVSDEDDILAVSGILSED